MKSDLTKLNAGEVRKKLIKKEFSAIELVEAFLRRIKTRDKEINAFLFTAEDSAIDQARRLDKKIKNKEAIGSLAGVPMAIKDNILVDGMPATSGSKILQNYIAPYDATVIRKLKNAGVIILGKTNMDEFAMGSSTESSAFGPTKNPRDLSRVPGGSSGGSAAAVAADECVCALGSDTGGSVRQPAAFCGVFGMKPTYGRVSRYGLAALGSSLDQIGVLAKTAEDAQNILRVIEGKDEMDSTSFDLKSMAQENGEIDVKNLKIGIVKEHFAEGLDPRIKDSIMAAVKKYEALGAMVVEISLPCADYSLPCYYIIQPAEASANLARYDGIRYGLSEQGKDLLHTYLETRGQGFGAEAKRRIMLGTYILSAGYYDAYYLKAQKVRALIREDFDRAFEKVDVIMGPTAPTLPFKLGEKSNDPMSMYLADIYTVAANLAGLPCLSMPCGQVDGLPVGLHLLGRRFDDYKLLEIAKLFDL